MYLFYLIYIAQYLQTLISNDSFWNISGRRHCASSRYSKEKRFMHQIVIAIFQTLLKDPQSLHPHEAYNWSNMAMTSSYVQETHMVFIEDLLDNNIDWVRERADAKSSAIDMALPEIKEAIKAHMLFLRRYDL